MQDLPRVTTKKNTEEQFLGTRFRFSTHCVLSLDTFLIQMIKFQDMTSYVCFTKLNKLKKIEYDLAHRLDSLTAEKNALIITLRSKDTAVSQPLPAATLEVGGKVGPQLPSVTPTKKRPIILSHTTRKVKKPVTSPRRILPQPGISSPAEVIQKGKRISVNLFSPDKVKVTCFVKFIVELQCIVPPPPFFSPQQVRGRISRL